MSLKRKRTCPIDKRKIPFGNLEQHEITGLDIFLFLTRNTDCGYKLEPHPVSFV